MMWTKKAMMADGMTPRLKMKSSCRDRSSNGSTFLLLNRVVKKREHRDKPKQNKKRGVKPKRLMRNIPKVGARAKEILKDRKK